MTTTINWTPSSGNLGFHLTDDNFNFIFTAKSTANSNPVRYLEIVPSIVEPRGTVDIIPDPGTDDGINRYYVGEDTAGEPLGVITINLDDLDYAQVIGYYTLSLFPNYEASWVNPGDSKKFTKRGYPWITVPPKKDLTEAKPDPTQSINILYTARATLQTGLIVEKVYTHTIHQDYTSLRDWIRGYLNLPNVRPSQEVASPTDLRFRTGVSEAGDELGDY